MKKFFSISLIIFQICLPLITFFLCQRLSIGKGYDIQTINPYILVINLTLWTVTYLLFLGIFKINYRAIFFYLLFFIIFTIANRYKIKFLNLPVRINDLTWGKEAIAFVIPVIKQTDMKKELIISLGILITSFFFLKHFLKFQIKNLFLRLFFILISLIILTLPYNNPQLFDQILTKTNIVFKTWSPIENCQNNGILLCFIYDQKYLKFPEPPDYNEAKIKQIYSETKNLLLSKEVPEQNEGSRVNPNIIIIMSESFWDATKLVNVKFSEDPIKNIREDIKSNFISPAFAGETSNVEFEILTGLSNYFFSANSYPYTQYLKKSLPSLFSIFKENNYYTTAIHPYNYSIYNRNNVYKYFGIDKFTSLDKMVDYQKAGPFVSDQSFTKEVLKQLNSSDQNQLIFALSIQNHAPYEANRFPIHKITFKSSLDQSDTANLQSYIDGINLSDQYYSIFKAELIKIKKPTIILFLGDHLPFLGIDFDIYKKTGFDYQNEMKIHTTPLAVWSNFETNLNLPVNISPSFLSLEILKMANIKPKYQFSYIDSIKEKSQILNQQLPSDKFTSEDLKNYELVQYDLIFGKQYGIK